MAALGMPNTTQDSSFCAIVMPPAAFTVPIPCAPSSPIPVIKTAMPFGPNSSARLLNSTSAEGRCPFTRGSSLSTATSPSGKRFTLRCRLPGQIRTRPANSISPDWASFTPIEQISSNRRANISVKPSGICCTTTIDPGKIRRQLGEYVLKCLRSAGGNADGYDPCRYLFGVDGELLAARMKLRHGRHPDPTALTSGFYFRNQLLRDLRHARRNVLRLGYKIERSQRQCL